MAAGDAIKGIEAPYTVVSLERWTPPRRMLTSCASCKRSINLARDASILYEDGTGKWMHYFSLAGNLQACAKSVICPHLHTEDRGAFQRSLQGIIPGVHPCTITKIFNNQHRSAMTRAGELHETGADEIVVLASCLKLSKLPRKASILDPTCGLGNIITVLKEMLRERMHGVAGG